MSTALQYIIDNKGRKTSVLVPLNVWNDLNENYQKLQKKLAVLNNIYEGINELKQARKTGRKLQTLKNFLT